MHEIIRYKTIDSTNTRLKLIADEAPDGLVAIAEEQTGGRGRFDRKWESEPQDGAWFSVLVKNKKLNNENAAGLVFVCALAVCRALRRLTGSRDFLIKWPNDIVIHGKKVTGILCESGFVGAKIGWSVCGIGINLNQEAFGEALPHASSVFLETGIKIQPEEALKATLDEFDEILTEYFDKGLAPILALITPFSATLGKTVRILNGERDFIGEATGFDTDGALIVYEDGVMRRVCVGDVSVRGIMGYV